MASPSGFSRLLHLSCSNTHTKYTKSENFSVSHICCVKTVQKRSIAVAVSSDHNNSYKPHRYQHPAGQSPRYRQLDKYFMEHGRKVEHVRQLIQSTAVENDPIESLLLVDAIERLGIDFYFEEEIETILRQHYKVTSERVYGFCSLHDVSLLFRLLRQHGYYISADVFNNFKGRDGRFRGNLSQDIRGLLELYEAAQLSLEGEYTLEAAAYFSSHLLQERLAVGDVDYNWSRIVTNKLRHPYHKTTTRLTDTDFLQDLGGLNIQSKKTLSDLAIMDLHKRQPVYQNELLQISRWWKELDLAKNLKLVRDQPLKWYTWSMALLIDDINMSLERVELTKSISLIYLMDDIFDLYGTLDELIIFTEAVNKWDYGAIDTLPEYMKMCYRALLDTTNEIGHKIYQKHGYNPIDSLKRTWASLCDAFLVEAKWLVSGDMPRADVYLENAKVSSGVHVALIHSFFLVGLGGVNGGAIRLNDTSKLVSSVAAILRLWDDLGSAKDEHQDGKDGSYIECYVKEHAGISVGQAREHVIDMIANEWKGLNKECICLNQFLSPPFKKACLNLARMVPLMYSYDDNQDLPVLEEYVKFMLFDQTTQGALDIVNE